MKTETEKETFEELAERGKVRLVCNMARTINNLDDSCRGNPYCKDVLSVAYNMYDSCFMALNDKECIDTISIDTLRTVLKSLVIRYSYFTHIFNDNDRAAEFNSAVQNALNSHGNGTSGKEFTHLIKEFNNSYDVLDFLKPKREYESLEEYVEGDRIIELRSYFRSLQTIDFKKATSDVNVLLSKCSFAFTNHFHEDDLLLIGYKLESPILLNISVTRLCILESLEREKERASKFRDKLNKFTNVDSKGYRDANALATKLMGELRKGDAKG